MPFIVVILLLHLKFAFLFQISEATQVGSYIARVSLSDPDGIVTTSLSLSFFGGDNKWVVFMNYK